MLSSFNIIHKRHICQTISTPLFYINSLPHVGHIYTFVLADAINRFNRMILGPENVFFFSGTDEHGLKVQEKALLTCQTAQSYSTLTSKAFEKIFNQFDNSMNMFIRTTDPLHAKRVHSVWKNMERNHAIYKGKYKGWYSVSDECYVTKSWMESHNVKNQNEPVDSAGRKCIWIEENTYNFNFKSYKNQVKRWLENAQPVYPRAFNEEAIKMIDDMDDICVSRSSEKVYWGVQVPQDPSQTIYVWFDALFGYFLPAHKDPSVMPVSGPIDCHVFGKDILKFHAIYLPAFLLAADYYLPKKLICHSHWLMDDSKMSKSKGNVIKPLVEINRITAEGLRYYLLRTCTLQYDCNYDKQRSIETINAELANKYGNLLARVTSKMVNPEQLIPIKVRGIKTQEENKLMRVIRELPYICEQEYHKVNLSGVVNNVMSAFDAANQYLEVSQPWKLVKLKDDQTKEKLNNILALTCEILRIGSLILLPIVPKTAQSVLDKIDAKNRTWLDTKTVLENNFVKLENRKVSFFSLELDRL